MNPYKIVSDFEEVIADFAGSKYAVAVESGTAAIFLSLMWRKEELLGDIKMVKIPKHTYPSVPCSIIHAGGKVIFDDIDWHGQYELYPLRIYDAALRFKKGMYLDLPYNNLRVPIQCLSFHIKKLLPIGRGGMILTDDKEAYEWFKLARFDGRNPVPLLEDDFKILGWNCYMEPANAARGLQLFQAMGNKELPDLEMKKQGYPDLSQFKIYSQ